MDQQQCLSALEHCLGAGGGGGSGSGTCVKIAVVELRAEVIVKQWHERGGEESGLT